MRFTIYQESRIGRRQINEDRMAYSYSRDALLMVIADGMGGHLLGEIAAQIAVQYVADAFQREAKPALADPLGFLSLALTNAHHAITEYAERRALPDVPRTTCAACIVQDGRALWAHAGDTRLYIIRRGKVMHRTQDHSRVQNMIDEGLISLEEADGHPMRNRLYSCLGGPQSPRIDFSTATRLRHGDVLLLCTDGLWSPLGEAGILAALASGEVMTAIPPMMNEAEARSGVQCDNLSAICMRWDDQSAEGPGGEGSVLTQSLSAGRFTTQLEGFGQGESLGPGVDLTDEEIERTVAEIRNAIQKYAKPEDPKK